MEAMNFTPNLSGETTDVTEWLSRAGLRFEDLGNDTISVRIRQQWRAYQAAVHRHCVATGNPPERIKLTGAYAKLRVPIVGNFQNWQNSYWNAQYVEQHLFN